MRRRAVCISRSDGAGGAEIGRLVAKQLGYLYVDDEIVAEAASRGGVAAADVADEERRKSAVRRVLEEIGRGIAVETHGLTGLETSPPGEPTGEAIRTLVKEAIEAVAERGGAVIASHAASFALSGRPEVLRVFVTASPATRARRLSEAEGSGAKDAERAIRASDAARADYLRRFYGVDEELPTHYDVVVNTDALDVEQAADLIARAAS